MKRILGIILFLTVCVTSSAQKNLPDSVKALSNEYLDTVVVFRQIPAPNSPALLLTRFATIPR